VTDRLVLPDCCLDFACSVYSAQRALGLRSKLIWSVSVSLSAMHGTDKTCCLVVTRA